MPLTRNFACIAGLGSGSGSGLASLVCHCLPNFGRVVAQMSSEQQQREGGEVGRGGAAAEVPFQSSQSPHL